MLGVLDVIFRYRKDEYLVTPATGGGYRFIKVTGKGGEYTVTQGDSGPACSCPGAKYHGHCKHIVMLEMFRCLPAGGEGEPALAATDDECPF